MSASQKRFFWFGIVVSSCCSSLLQDALGQEGMRHMLEHHWVSASYSVPIALAVLVGFTAYVITVEFWMPGWATLKPVSNFKREADRGRDDNPSGPQ